MPPTYFLVMLILSIILCLVFPAGRILFPPYAYFGFFLIAFGIVVNLWADLIFKREKTTVRPDETPKNLVTSGPFCLSRHPMYLGMAAILLGVAIVHGVLVSFLFPLLFVVLIEIKFIPTEERNLEKAFGKHYLEYEKKVRRWI